MNFESVMTTISSNPLTTALLVVVIILLFAHALLVMRLSRFMRGGNGKSLESEINFQGRRIEALESALRDHAGKISNLNARVAKRVKTVGLKRFDPFGARQGEQSFATALLDENGTGIVISGIHSRDGVRVYAKEVEKFASERELSDEERAAIGETK